MALSAQQPVDFSSWRSTPCHLGMLVNLPLVLLFAGGIWDSQTGHLCALCLLSLTDLSTKIAAIQKSTLNVKCFLTNVLATQLLFN